MRSVETQRLLLRLPEVADAEPFLEMHQAPNDWPGIDLGWLIHRSRWGNGFATEASRAAIAWSWRTGKIDHIISLTSPDHPQSLRIALKIGQQFEKPDVDPI